MEGKLCRGSDSNGEKNNDLHRDGCSAGGQSGRKRVRLNPLRSLLADCAE